MGDEAYINHARRAIEGHNRRADEAAALERLRAENEQLRAALQRLVDLKDGSMYLRPKAWDDARAALATAEEGDEHDDV